MVLWSFGIGVAWITAFKEAQIPRCLKWLVHGCQHHAVPRMLVVPVLGMKLPHGGRDRKRLGRGYVPRRIEGAQAGGQCSKRESGAGAGGLADHRPSQMRRLDDDVDFERNTEDGGQCQE